MFDATSFSDYEDLIEELTRVFGKWLCVGPTTLVRKRDIVGMFYLGGQYVEE
jgi:hypothetical protein